MDTTKRASRVRRGGPATVTVALLAAGCAPSANHGRYQRLAADAREAAPAAPEGELFAGAATLDREALVRAVLARNPDVAAARQALRAALAEYPRATALEDPMVSYALAPASVFSDRAPFGQSIRVGQRFPFPGKLDLAGEMVLAEAEMERGDVDAVRLRLALTASQLFAEYYATARALAITAEHVALLEELKAAAEVQYAAGRAAAQDPLMAEVEAGMLAQRRIGLAAQQKTIAAELNGLLHRAPEAPLPPPPATLEPSPLPDADSARLQSLALERRPEIASMRAGIDAARASASMAEREYYPDFEVMGEYNSMWDMPEHQWMTGVAVNVPLQVGARDAAVEQAEARTARARHELERMEDEVRVEVDRALTRLREADDVMRVFESRVLPAARSQVEAARIGFISAATPFVAVIEAERNLRNVQLDLEMARATLLQRRAELERATASGIEAGAPPAAGGER